jgi:hypothetical protein
VTHNAPSMGNGDLFYRIWKQCRKEACGSECGGNCSVCRPAPWVVERLLELVSNEPGKTIEELSSSIRGIVEESRFAGGEGELLTNPPVMPAAENQFHLVMMTLERMRSADASWESLAAGR